MTTEDSPSIVPWGPDEQGEPRSRWARVRRQVTWLLVGVLVLVLALSGAVFGITQNLASQVNRVPGVFAPLNATARPAPGAGQTFLLVGTDSRSPDPTTGGEATASDFTPGAQRSDVIMLATIAPDGSHASLASIPRDSWVDIPGRGKNKINAAYSFGGPSLLISTVEQLTRVRVDHFAVIDFAGFQQMTDAAGGIDVNVGTATTEFGQNLAAGPQRLNGAQALAYVRQRHFLPAGDFDRVRRQQNALRALASSAINSGTLTNPVKAYGLADALTRWVSVDDTMTNNDLRSLVWGLRDIRTSNIDFLTAPYSGTGMEGPQSVVYLNNQQGSDLWFAMNTDQVGGYVARYPNTTLPAVPR